MIVPATWTDEEELAEALVELSRARRSLLMTELADMHGRVCNYGLWRHSLRRQRENVKRLETVVAGLTDRLEAET